MDVLSSARRHGVADEDARHALAHAVAIEEVGEDPTRYLVLGRTARATWSSSSCWTARRVRP